MLAKVMPVVGMSAVELRHPSLTLDLLVLLAENFRAQTHAHYELLEGDLILAQDQFRYQPLIQHRMWK